MEMPEFFNYVYFGNTVLDYIICAAIVLSSITAIRLLKFLVIKLLKRLAAKTVNQIDDFLVHNLERFIIPFLYFLSVYAGAYYLKLSAKANIFINTAIVVIFTYFAIRFFAMLLNYSVRYYWQKKDGAEKSDARLKGIGAFINLVAWSLGIIFLLDNLGFRISTIIAGLGIGGIAVALAAQAVLGDLFSYFVIFFDRPFEVGDFIVIDDKSGTVEFIGIKTTRIASLGGEQLIISNSDLTRSRIHNYKRLLKRRVVFTVMVTYQTPAEKLKMIPQIVRNIIEGIENAAFDRSHFQSFQSLGLNYETVYYVIGPDYNKYMDIQQTINLSIFEEFQKLGIEFAYPVQTLISGQQGSGKQTV